VCDEILLCLGDHNQPYYGVRVIHRVYGHPDSISIRFGEALFAVPLLAFCIPLGVAAPLAVLVSITIASIVVVQDWKKIHLGSAGWLVLSSLFGIPLGLLLLTSSHQRIVKATLAVIIMTFSVYSFIGRTPPELRRDSRLWLSSLWILCRCAWLEPYGMNGPPLVVYGAMRRWSAQNFRATLQGIFSTLQRYWYGWLLVRRTSGLPMYTRLLFALIAGHILGVFFGRAINHRLSRRSFF